LHSMQRGKNVEVRNVWKPPILADLGTFIKDVTLEEGSPGWCDDV